MDKRTKLFIKILDTKIELNEYTDVEEVAEWTHYGTDEFLPTVDLLVARTDALVNGFELNHTVKELKKKLSDNQFMLRLGKAVHRCRKWHECGIDIPFRLFVLPDYIGANVRIMLKKVLRRGEVHGRGR